MILFFPALLLETFWLCFFLLVAVFFLPTFTPELFPTSGDYEVSIRFNDEHIPDSPFIVPVASPSDDARRLTVASLQVRLWDTHTRPCAPRHVRQAPVQRLQCTSNTPLAWPAVDWTTGEILPDVRPQQRSRTRWAFDSGLNHSVSWFKTFTVDKYLLLHCEAAPGACGILLEDCVCFSCLILKALNSLLPSTDTWGAKGLKRSYMGCSAFSDCSFHSIWK